MPDGIRIHRWSAWPIVEITFPSRPMQDQELAEYLADAAEGLKVRNDCFGIVTNIGERSLLTPRQRRMQADFLNEYEFQMRTLCKGQAFVVAGPVARGIQRAVMWIAPPPHPCKVFDNRAAALVWVREKLAAAGVTMREM